MEEITVCMVEVIKVELKVGTGTKENPIRTVIQYWDKKGNLLFERDDISNKKAEDNSTFLEQYHNSLKVIGDKPLSVQ